jgi:PKD repeat protein
MEAMWLAVRRGITVLLVATFLLSSFSSIDIADSPTTYPYILWQGQLRTLAQGGDISGPQVHDLDRDGTPEIVVSSGDSVYALKPDGHTKWRYTINGTVTGVVARDLNGDGKAEVIAGTEEGALYTLNYDGGQMWTYEAGSAISASPSAADLDSDGKAEVVFGTAAGDVLSLHSDSQVHWKTPVEAAILASPTIGDLTFYDTNPRVVVTTGDRVYQIEGNGQERLNFEIEGGGPSWVALGPMDHDDQREVVVVSSGEMLITYLQERKRVPVNGTIVPPILVDLDGDEAQEVVLGSATGLVSTYDVEGQEGWQTGLGSAITGLSAILAPSLTLLVTTSDGMLTALDASGQETWSMGLGFVPENPPVAVDIDGDLEMEMVLTGSDGIIALVETHRVIEKEWSAPGHDVRNTRSLDGNEDGRFPWRTRWMIDELYNITDTIIADLEADGKKEVITFQGFWTNSSQLDIFESDGKHRGVHHPDGLNGTPLATDVAGDKGADIVTVTKDGVQVMRGDLYEFWNYSMNGSMAIAAADIDGDDKAEVFVGNESGRIGALASASGTEIWTDDVGGKVLWVTAADLGSDGTLEVMFSTDDGIMFVRNATNGDPLWASQMFSDGMRPPVIADLDGDGLTDVTAISLDGTIIGYSGNGTQLWKKTVMGSPMWSLAVDGEDAGHDLVLLTDEANLHIIDGNGGADMAVVEVDEPVYYLPMTAGPITKGQPIAICVPVEDGYRFFNKQGEQVFLYTSCIFPTNSPPMHFGDLEGDGKLEAVASKDIFDYLRVVDLDVGPGATVPWTMTGHDPGRTYNPYSLDGLFLPDLEISTSDITFDPPLVLGPGQHDVDITFRNQGPVESGDFTINVSIGADQITSVDVTSLPPFTEASASFKVDPGEESIMLTVALDLEDTVQEVNEENNIASRHLFVNEPPVADAGPDRKVLLDQPVAFDGTNSTDVDGTIVNYTWDFGDTNTAYGPLVTHTFIYSGSYNVTLTVTDRYGLTSIDNATIRVNYAPTLIEWSPKGDPTINEGDTVDFYVMASDPDGDDITIEWSFEDVKVGEGPTWSYWANYSSAGIRTVKALASDGHMSTEVLWDVKVVESNRLIESALPESPVTISQGRSGTFTVLLSQGAQGALIQWFMDGELVQTGRDSFKIHAGEASQGDYELMVEVKGDNGRDFHVWDITIGPSKDEVKIRWAYPEGTNISTNAGVPVWFGVSVEGGSVQWSLDDATVLGGNGPSYKFDEWGNSSYKVTVTVSSDTASLTQSWTVNVNYPPLAEISASKLNIAKGKKVTFDGTGSHDHEVNGSIATYSWDLGDGTTATGAVVKHAYDKAGTYKVTLTVTDAEGLQGQTSVNIIVKAEPEASPGFEPILVITIMAIVFMIRRRRDRT